MTQLWTDDRIRETASVGSGLGIWENAPSAARRGWVWGAQIQEYFFISNALSAKISLKIAILIKLNEICCKSLVLQNCEIVSIILAIFGQRKTQHLSLDVAECRNFNFGRFYHIVKQYWKYYLNYQNNFRKISIPSMLNLSFIYARFSEMGLRMKSTVNSFALFVQIDTMAIIF